MNQILFKIDYINQKSSKNRNRNKYIFTVYINYLNIHFLFKSLLVNCFLKTENVWF